MLYFMKLKIVEKHDFVDFDENRENRGLTTSKTGVWRKRSKTLFFDPIRKTPFLRLPCFHL